MSGLSVKLRELLTLPSLKEAEVITGENQLERRVTSLSFLEVSDMAFFEQNMRMPYEYVGGELVISSLFTVKDDVEKQCETIRHLHNLGEVGILLYYVGIILPDLAPKVIETAEALDFVIIQMPKNNFSLRYNEAIIEIMTELLKQKPTDTMVNEVLEKASALPVHRQSVDMTLKIVADFLRTNILLTNDEEEVINQIKWPRNSTMDLKEFLGSLSDSRVGFRPASKVDYSSELSVSVNLIDGQTIQQEEFSIFYKEIYHKDNGRLHLYLIKEHELLTQEECEQAVEVVRVALNLWGKKHGEVSEFALVQAILNDESEKMFRLASKLSVDVKGIDKMWLVQLKTLAHAKEIKEELSEQASKNYQTSLVQIIEKEIVVLLGNHRHSDSELDLGQVFVETSRYKEEIMSIVFCPRMRHTADVRQTYQLINDVVDSLPIIFPNRIHFSLSEIRQVQKGRKIVRSGELQIAEQLRILEPILENEEYLTTLSLFLLDAQADFQHCSELLFVHKNTVKYRIKKISELIGYEVTGFSESYECSLACMVQRLVTQ
ncbi:PucR family transcriptional regulator [Enterococcus sp. AZ194]|uniref:PucR family transcriptional regulator n=1 Tax=Enterococcus sp. AZ194 TaxID=2774629 RepID=UPI003F688CC3